MLIYFDIFLLQSLSELDCSALSGKLCDDNAAYIESLLLKLTDETQYIHVICDTQITSDFILLYICCTDYNDDFRYIRELHEHLQLTVRLEARQNSGCMVIIKQLTAKFQIQLVSELTDSLLNMLRLNLQILIIIKTYSHVCFLSLTIHYYSR